MKKLIIVVFSVIISFAPASVFALSPEKLDYYNRNKIYFYNPDGGECDVASTATGSYSGQTSRGLSELQAGFVDTYHAIAESLSIQYGIPWETVMAQGILESASGTSRFARERNNFFGIGAFDSNPNAARSYSSPEEGWRGYYENIRVTATYRNHGVFQGDTITNPYSYLQAIKNAGYATDPNYVSKVSQYIDAIIVRAREKGWKTSSELAAENPEMISNAGNSASGSSSSSNSAYAQNCITTGTGGITRGNGSVNQTALTLAWPSGGHALDNPTDTYRRALEATGVSRLGDRWSMMGASCDAFVATVYRYSGVDPNFYCCGVSNGGIISYLQNSGKYVEVNHSGTSGIAAGDIMINSHHVAIIVQRADGSFATADASHASRTAEVHNLYNLNSYRIFRIK